MVHQRGVSKGPLKVAQKALLTAPQMVEPMALQLARLWAVQKALMTVPPKAVQMAE
eukprot:CAMPEP_0114432066 /NCGR_PEP_ID=MMETSP0103-20121206/10951_1 /TAXON_ID=37642 ORGANISM="Paraphysomonas imperforata, Strain PA2" /NCGR_SAMPLE_ID=MMETSP0103 /ASSEMBLY_ACC=CAM_ASM_000201 /LENGTH=55 /DNA_ID=CAMNT_0001601705 /DNA_START=342 /DNA_END=509 /DNA_ORIENTATION=+